MKKFLVLTLIAVLSVGLAACGGGPDDVVDPNDEMVEEASAEAPEQTGELFDGTYSSEMFYEGDDGYLDTVTITVAGGKITAVDWNGNSPSGGDDRRTASEKGEYEIADWHEQAAKMEAKIIETQDPYAITLNDDGTTSDVPGVTIPVEDFLSMVDATIYDAQQPAEE